MSVSKEKIFVLSLSLSYVLFFHYFSDLVFHSFSEIQGYERYSFSLFGYVFGSFLIIFGAFVIPLDKSRGSSLVVWFLYYFHISPSVLIFLSLTNIGVVDYLYFSVLSVFIYVSLSRLVFLTPKCYSGKVSTPLIFFVLIAFSFSSVYLTLRDFGFNVSAPSLFDVYNVRSEYIDNVSLLSGYSSILNGYFFSPVFIFLAIYFYNVKKLFACVFFASLSFFLSYVVYSASGFKSVAFMFFVVFVLSVVIRYFKYVSFGVLVSVVVNLVFLFGFLLLFLFGFDDFIMHWVRRTLVVPGMNVAYFFDYALTYDFEFLGSAPLAISEHYYGTNGSANAGVLGDGVYRFGFFLFWINIFIFYFYIFLIEFFSGRNSRFFASLFFPTAYALANSTVTSVLLTYGLLPCLIFVLFFRRFFNSDKSHAPHLRSSSF